MFDPAGTVLKMPPLSEGITRAIRRGVLEPIAIRALLKATHLLGRALGARLAQLRESDDPLLRSHGQTELEALHARCLQELLEIHLARWARMPERRRPHYAPQERYRILRLKVVLAQTQSETARLSAVSPGTIARWEAEVESNPGAETVGALVRPKPPVTRYADVVRHVVQTMALAGLEGKETIARTLARAGWKLSASTVGRVRREGPVPAQTPEPSQSGRRVAARSPNHVWMADLTEITGLFRLFTWKLAVVFDVFSRMPLGWRIFNAEPSSAAIAALVDEAANRHGSPKHFVSD